LYCRDCKVVSLMIYFILKKTVDAAGCKVFWKLFRTFLNRTHQDNPEKREGEFLLFEKLLCVMVKSILRVLQVSSEISELMLL
jgi:hypothetical protein